MFSWRIKWPRNVLMMCEVCSSPSPEKNICLLARPKWTLEENTYPSVLTDFVLTLHYETSNLFSYLLFNIYIHNLPSTISSKCSSADDLVLLNSQTLKEILSQDMNTIWSYLQIWRLQLNHNSGNNDRLSPKQQKCWTWYNNNKLLLFCLVPSYLEALCKKLRHALHCWSDLQDRDGWTTIANDIKSLHWLSLKKTNKKTKTSLVY